MPRKLNLLQWFLSFFEAKPRTNKYSDFVTVSRSGCVRVNLMGWWNTPEGRAELDAEIEKSRKFEAECRARDPEGKFSFYD